MKYDITNLNDLDRTVETLLTTTLKDRQTTILALVGDLGTGKTTFTKHLAKHLGVKEVVNSPTFLLMKEYQTNHNAWQELVHIDAYRLDSVDELEALRFSELWFRKRTIICIEWADKIASALPKEKTIQGHFSLVKNQRLLDIIV